MGAQHLPKLGGAGSFFACCNQKDLASRLYNVRSGRDALDGLIKSQVQRIPGATCNDTVQGFVKLLQHGTRNKRCSLKVGFDGVAGEDPGNCAVAGENDVEQEIMPGDPGNLK